MKGIIGSLSFLGRQAWHRAAFVVVALSALIAFGAPACGTSTPAPSASGASKTCQLNSDCTAPLICAIGVCREQCAQDSDCPGIGSTCVFGIDTNTNTKSFFCQAAKVANAACSTPKDCMAPMACASDYRCRNLCMTDADCNVLGAVNKVCAQDANGVDYCASLGDVTVNAMGDQVLTAPPNPATMTDAAVVEPANAPMVMIVAPEGGLPDATMGASSGAMGGSGSMSASGAGSGSAGSATGSAGATSGTASGASSGAVVANCTPPCGQGQVCVGTTCMACGSAGDQCCKGSGCVPGLVCSSANICECGNANEPCCANTSCNSAQLTCEGNDAGGLNMCTCGDIGTKCCPTTGNAPACLNGATCAGTKCGCVAVFDTDYSTSPAIGLALRVDGTVYKANVYAGAAQGPGYVPVTTSLNVAIRASAIAASGQYTTAVGCAIVTNGAAPGQVDCFPLADKITDSSFLGAGGDNMTTTTSPVVVTQSGAALPAIAKIAGGTNGSANFCAIDTTGAAWCWGYGIDGELGHGDTSNASYARPVLLSDNTTQFSGVTDIRVGHESTCAVKTDGSVWCWGTNYYGELGVPPTMYMSKYYPTQVFLSGATATRLAAGPYNTQCAIMTDTSVVCWGQNNYSQAGFPYDAMDGTRIPTTVPAGAMGTAPLMNVVDLVGGNYNTCAKVSGTLALVCWGNASGFPNGKAYPTAAQDSSNNAIQNVASPLTNSSYGYIGYVDPNGSINSGGTIGTPQVDCGMLTASDGGAL